MLHLRRYRFLLYVHSIVQKEAPAASYIKPSVQLLAAAPAGACRPLPLPPAAPCRCRLPFPCRGTAGAVDATGGPPRLPSTAASRGTWPRRLIAQLAMRVAAQKMGIRIA